MAFETIKLPTASVGNQAHIHLHRFGPSGGKKVYIQAGLHADEYPGMLVAQHLLRHLEQLDQQSAIKAEILLVPFANPVGLRQRSFGHVIGRCDWHTGQNFNRNMAINPDQVITTLSDSFGDDSIVNDRIMREGLKHLVSQRTDDFEINSLHKALLSYSIDAHYVLDLHCDDVALPHVFYGTHQQDAGKALAHAMGFEICLEEDVTGTVAFDGTHTQPWVTIENHLDRNVFSQPCFAATLELRGKNDVSPELAEKDCLGILDFLAHENLIHRIPTPQKPVQLRQLGVDQVRMVKASISGIVTYRSKLGDTLKAGEPFADIVLLDSPIAKSIPILSPCDGYLFSATGHYFTTKGDTIAMLATNEQQSKAGTQLAF
jgi:predicted deacylase